VFGVSRLKAGLKTYFAFFPETLCVIRSKLIISIFVLLLGVAACATSNPARYSITKSNAYEASLFRQNCAICHGPEGEGKALDDGRVTPNIRDGIHKYNTDEEIYNHIANGGNGMVPFRDQLTEREIRLMVAFVQNDLRGHNK
jgi:mono/diheme cytochrome c family protein